MTSALKFSIARKFSNAMIQTNPAPSTAMRCETQSMMQVLGKKGGWPGCGLEPMEAETGGED